MEREKGNAMKSVETGGILLQGRKPVVVIGGTSSGVGKTSISVGLMAALRYVDYS